MAAKKAKGELDRGVRWTPELRAEVWSERGRVVPEFQDKALEDARDPRAAFEQRADYARRGKYGGSRVALEPKLRAGLAKADARARAWTEAALDACEEKTPPRALDADVEATMVALELVPVFAAFPFWLSHAGPELAMRALVLSHRRWSSARRHGYGSSIVLVVDDTCAGDEPEYADSAWRMLRAVVAEADDATYARLRAQAERLREGAPAPVVSYLSVAFPSEAAWAAEAADAANARGEAAAGWERMLVTATDLDRAERLARSGDWELDEDMLLTVLARHGGDGARVIAAAIDAASNNEHRKDYAKLLSIVENELAARAFARALSVKAIAPVAQKWFKRVPEVARPALEAIVREAGPSAKAARIVLDAL